MRQTFWQTFGVPLTLLGVTVAALVLGLVAKGWADAAAVVALASPLLIIAGCLLRRRAVASARRADD